MVSARPVRIAPSLLAADFSRLAEDISVAEAGGADVLHLDIMDGHFVPNLSFGVPVVAAISKVSDLFLDTHLMITDPGKYAEPFVSAGAGGITFHIEVVEDDPQAVVRTIRDLGARVGVAVNPGTPAEALDGIIEEVDLVLVMTVWPGFGGQKFIHDCLPKIEALAGRLRDDQWLEVDGGVDASTVSLCAAAGADTFVAGSAVFGRDDVAGAIAELRSNARGAVAGR